MKFPLNLRFNLIVIMIVTALPACAGQPTTSLADQCREGLDAAYNELEQAEAKGLGGSVSIVKASGLLAGAKVQQQFSKFPNCIDKVKRARYYIQQARIGSDT